MVEYPRGDVFEVHTPSSYQGVRDALSYVVKSYPEPREHCETIMQMALEDNVITGEEAEELRKWVEGETKCENQL